MGLGGLSEAVKKTICCKTLFIEGVSGLLNGQNLLSVPRVLCRQSLNRKLRAIKNWALCLLYLH